MNHQQLIKFSKNLLLKAGLSKKKARIVAETLVEADLLGHQTHGLQLLEAYLTEIEKGGMRTKGQPKILSKKAALTIWNGRYLPGPWLVEKAIEKAIKKAKKDGTATIIIQKSHHIACLAAYLEAVTKQNLMILLACSDPMNSTVAPFGGTKGVYSPNPLAIGIPTTGESILIDISMSTTSNALIIQKNRASEKLPHKWLLDNQGEITDEPSTFFQNPPATILPLGGLDTGYKGFGLGIMIEALTNALSGFGRAKKPTRWGASVFLQIIDPRLLGDSFAEEMTFFKEECLKSTPISLENPIRMPGSKGLLLKKKQLEKGLELRPSIVEALEGLALKYHIDKCS